MVMPIRLHLPRSLYDFSVCDFSYDILDIMVDNWLRHRCSQFMRASYYFLLWHSSIRSPYDSRAMLGVRPSFVYY